MKKYSIEHFLNSLIANSNVNYLKCSGAHKDVNIRYNDLNPHCVIRSFYWHNNSFFEKLEEFLQWKNIMV